MKRFENKLISDIVVENINTSIIFKEFDIDYSIEGKKNLFSLCEKKGLSIKKVTDKLSSVNTNVYYLQDYNTWELDFLIHFLSEIHHDYKEENILLLKEYGQKVADLYSKRYLELKEINLLIQNITEDILEHMKNEETILFPYLKELIKIKEENTNSKNIDLPKVQSIEDFEDDHLKIRTTFKRIAKLSKNYTIPEKGVCDSFKLLYHKLQKFDDELQDHIHIENNILFPKAKKLESKVIGKEKIVYS